MGQSTLHWLQETEADWTERLFILMAETSHWRYMPPSFLLLLPHLFPSSFTLEAPCCFYLPGSKLVSVG